MPTSSCTASPYGRITAAPDAPARIIAAGLAYLVRPARKRRIDVTEQRVEARRQGVGDIHPVAVGRLGCIGPLAQGRIGFGQELVWIELISGTAERAGREA